METTQAEFIQSNDILKKVKVFTEANGAYNDTLINKRKDMPIEICQPKKLNMKIIKQILIKMC